VSDPGGPIVILTGAGISAESGLGTFRDADGLWETYDLQTVATPEGFAANPALVHEFYNARRANLAAAEPNAAHHALARLLTARADVTLITQNIDNLHEQAGTPRVIHMHGELMRSLCPGCGAQAEAPLEMSVGEVCESCSAPGLRPDVVWFGEMPYHMPRLEALISEAATFAAIGTSGTVYPAAGFAAAARQAGAMCLELNLESSGSPVFHDQRLGPATEIVPAWVDDVLAV